MISPARNAQEHEEDAVNACWTDGRNTLRTRRPRPSACRQARQEPASLVEGAYYDQAETREAITYYEDFMILFPGDPNIAKKGRWELD